MIARGVQSGGMKRESGRGQCALIGPRAGPGHPLHDDDGRSNLRSLSYHTSCTEQTHTIILGALWFIVFHDAVKEDNLAAVKPGLSFPFFSPPFGGGRAPLDGG